MAPCSCAGDTTWGALGSWARSRMPPWRATRRQRITPVRIPRALCDLACGGRMRCLLGDSFLVELQRELEITRLVTRDLHGVDSGVARAAVRAALRSDGGHQPFVAQIRDAVHVEERRDLVHRVRRRDE